MTRPQDIEDRRQFIDAFSALVAGGGTTRAVADRTGGRVGHATIARIVKRESLPREETVRILAKALDPDNDKAWCEARKRVLRRTLSPPPPDSAVPIGPAVLLGRHRSVAELEDALLTRRNVLVSGMAGVGKTAFAGHVAGRLAPRFPGGQIYIDMRGYAQDPGTRTAQEALTTVLERLDQEIPASAGARVDSYRKAVAASPVLIILDNAPSSERIASLLLRDGPSRVIVTSRQHLPLPGDGWALTLDSLGPAEAVALLRSMMPADRAPAGDDELLRLANVCGGLPLALTLLGAKLKRRQEWTVDYLVQRVDDESMLFTDLADGERSVGAAFKVTYDDLSPGQQLFFRMLGTAPGTDIEPERAGALSGITPDRADQLLEEFLDRHLLLQQSPGRYRMHDLLSSYARRLGAAMPDERTDARRRLLEWTIGTAEARATDYLTGPPSQPGGGHLPSRDWFIAEHDNLTATVEAAAAWKASASARRLSAAVSRPLRVSGFYGNALTVATVWSTCADRPVDAAQARLAEGLAKIQLGRREEAVHDCRRALEAFRRAGDRGGQGAALKEIGNIHWYDGRYSQALDHYLQALPLQREADDRVGEAATLSNIGAVRSQMDEHQQAIEDYERALAIRREIGDRVGMAQTLNNLVLAHERLGQLDRASATLIETMSLGELLSDPALVCAALTNLGNICRRMELFDTGIRHLERAKTLAQGLVSRRLEAEAENGLGDLLVEARGYDRARGSYEAALDLAVEAGDRHEEAHALEGLGNVFSATRRRTDAEREWRRAASLYLELGLSAALVRVERRLDGRA